MGDLISSENPVLGNTSNQNPFQFQNGQQQPQPQRTGSSLGENPPMNAMPAGKYPADPNFARPHHYFQSGGHVSTQDVNRANLFTSLTANSQSPGMIPANVAVHNPAVASFAAQPTPQEQYRPDLFSPAHAALNGGAPMMASYYAQPLVDGGAREGNKRQRMDVPYRPNVKGPTFGLKTAGGAEMLQQQPPGEGLGQDELASSVSPMPQSPQDAQRHGRASQYTLYRQQQQREPNKSSSYFLLSVPVDRELTDQ